MPKRVRAFLTQEKDRKQPRVMRAIPWTPADYLEVQRAARKARVPFSRFVREVTLNAVRNGEAA